MKAFKGVSPLVAVVMLIAFTLLVAGILGGLVTQFATDQSSKIKYCTGAKVILLSGIQRTSNVSGLSDVTLSVHNYGDVELNFNILQTYVNATVRKVPQTFKVKANDVTQVTIPALNVADTLELTIQSQECAGAQDLIRATDLKTVS